jgi:hypothetical protein
MAARRIGTVGLLVAILAAGACSKDTTTPTAPGPSTAPAPTTASVAVGFPAGGTIFIGSTAQFEARETLTDGTTRVASSVSWGSDNPSVATVSSTGLVTAVAAGEATIFADAGLRGTMLIRVFPNFKGDWRGTEVVLQCQDSGFWLGFCELVPVGATGAHDSTFTQTDASVSARIDEGNGTSAQMTGTITVGGELQLPTTSVLPADPDVNAQVENWRSRSDKPSQMTGSYDYVLNAPGFGGSVRISLGLENVARTSSTSTLAGSGGGIANDLRGQVERFRRD